MSEAESTSSRPKTAYDLCQGVVDAIEAMPNNYYQASWAFDAKTLFPQREVCGTAFCRAGWMASQLADRPLKSSDDGAIQNLAINVLESAGVDRLDINTLFASWAARGRLGTPEYAESGIAGMRDFMQKWEPQLKGYDIKSTDRIS